MKTAILICIGIIGSILFFNSCEKDEEEDQNCRIQNIYIEDKIYEEYSYNSNGNPARVNYYELEDGTTITYYQTIDYEDGKPVKITTFNESDLMMEHIYPVLKIYAKAYPKSVEKLRELVQEGYLELYYAHGKLMQTQLYTSSGDAFERFIVMTYTYQNEKPVHIEYLFYFDEYTATQDISYTWTGDNITKEEWILDDAVYITNTYEYDDKVNKYEYFRTLFPLDNVNILSKNNITSINHTEGDDNISVSFEYTYNEQGYPVTIIETQGTEAKTLSIEYSNCK